MASVNTSTCLCLGPKYSGKTHLLSSMQNPGSINKTSHSVPTVGTNLYSIKLPSAELSTTTVVTKKNNRPKFIQVREVGGTMAPMWKNYLTDISKIMYVVDTSNLCQISAAGMSFLQKNIEICLLINQFKQGVLLYSLLAEPRLQTAKVLIVLTKMDLAYRQMRNEALLMMQMEKLKKQIRQTVTIVETSALSTTGHDQILNWLGDDGKKRKSALKTA